MKFRSGVLFGVLCVLSITYVKSLKLFSSQHTDLSLINFLAKAKEFADSDPENTKKCLEIHGTKIEKIDKDLENSLNLCDDTEKKAKQKIDNDALAARKSIEERSGGVCEKMSKCNIEKKPLEFFDCYALIVSSLYLIKCEMY